MFLNKTINDFWGPSWTSMENAFRSAQAFEITETADAYLITADVPGVKEDGLDISIKANLLTIKTKRDDRDQVFTKSYVIPAGAASADIKAQLEYGVLKVVIPKQPEAKPRKIPLRKIE